MFENFWDGQRIVGADSGLMLNLRVLRFVKSHFPSLNRANPKCFFQAQGYWIRENWDLFRLTGKSIHKRVALACSDYVVRSQRPDGSWLYPLGEWQKYVNTVDGTWASLGLLVSYQRTKEETYLKAALRWYDFLIHETGFQRHEDSLCVNYFAFSSKGIKVPNNTTLVLWFFAELFKTTGERKFTAFNDKLVRFLELCQKPNGELVYEVERSHYLCFQYNSFEFLDLAHYYDITGDARVRSIMNAMAKFIVSGVTGKGAVRFSCSQTFPEFAYFSGVTGAALISATSMGFGNYETHIGCIYRYLVKNQRPNGSFYHSKHDMIYVRNPIQWGFLTDRSAYPRQLSYLLQHLLMGIESKVEAESNRTSTILEEVTVR
jgi:hypothetical protein